MLSGDSSGFLVFLCSHSLCFCGLYFFLFASVLLSALFLFCPEARGVEALPILRLRSRKLIKWGIKWGTVKLEICHSEFYYTSQSCRDLNCHLKEGRSGSPWPWPRVTGTLVGLSSYTCTWLTCKCGVYIWSNYWCYGSIWIYKQCRLDVNYIGRKKLVVCWPSFTESFDWCRKVSAWTSLTVTSMLPIVSCFIFQISEE